jgi:hypothetical protein
LGGKVTLTELESRIDIGIDKPPSSGVEIEAIEPGEDVDRLEKLSGRVSFSYCRRSIEYFTAHTQEDVASCKVETEKPRAVPQLRPPFRRPSRGHQGGGSGGSGGRWRKVLVQW